MNNKVNVTNARISLENGKWLCFVRYKPHSLNPELDLRKFHFKHVINFHKI